ncbi:Ig-like domain-containing protein, partial [Emticicia agri]|uniref:Ig-like domain-containing protein n=2 Tax=Emticicia agri TaxID=2492393 RepID=UPI0035B69361
TIRAKNANGKWSTVVVRKFYKDALPSNINLANITRLEYFIDTDPGEGNGTNIPVTASSSVNNIPLLVNMSGLSQGTHFLEIRARDADGKWSTVGIKQFSNGTNRIAIGTIAADICGQNNLSLPYTLEGTFDSGNTVTVQLLDANNNLVNANIASITATASGTISVPMPNVGVNTVYKLRLVSSSPELISEPVLITVKSSFTPTITPSGDVNFCAGRSVLLSVSGCNGNVVWSNGITNNMISVTATGTFTATCTLSNGCSFPSSNTIITVVSPYPQPNSGGNVSVCGANSTATLTASGCNTAGDKIAWFTTASGGSSQFAGATYVTPPLPASTTYYVACVSEGGCESTRIPIAVTVKPLPTVAITGATNITCTTPSVTRTASGGGTYLWSNSLGTTATATITNAGTYTVTVTGANGCTATATTSVTANKTAPTVAITGSANLTCTVNSVTRTASGGSTYLWSNGLGTNAAATMTTAGIYTVTVTNTTNGCTTTATTSVTTNTTAPTVNITGTANLTCAVTSVTRTASGGGTYLWSNGLGTNAAATITTAGIYTVTVTNTTNGCTTTATTSVTTNTTAPTVNVTGTTNLTCTVTSVTRTASGGGTYLWSNGLGTNATANITTAGTYTVTVTGTNGCTATATTSVTSNTTAPTASITGSNNLSCVVTSVTRTASGGGTYLWSNGLGTNATATITSAGTYTVTVTGTNGCTATATTTVTSQATPPTPTISPASPPAICSSQSVTLSANGCTGGTITWSTGATGSSLTVSPATTTAYTARCKVDQCFGNNSAAVTVTVTPTCNYPITIQPALVVVCPNTSVTLTASGCPGVITWTGGATGTSITVTPAATGTYTATCSAGGSGSRVITVNATDVTLSNADNILTGTSKFQVTQNIISTSQIGQDATNPKPNVLYQAGKSIVLQPGFSTASGSIFNAVIQGCN